ncbi:MAG: M48 family metallopeptidase [Nitrospirae bacterium]|nr:M48 family metallopeptidase [Nitrospirota bacterium]
MTKYQLIIAISYIFVQGFTYWLKFINLRYMKQHGMKVPQGFEEYIDEATLKKTHAYSVEQGSLSFVESLLGSAMLLIFLFGGILNLYNSWVTSLQLPFILKGTVFFLLLGYINTILSVPFSLYSTFRIENKYGFNAMTPRLWIEDLAKSLLVSTVLSGLILLGSLWIIQASPDYWWVVVWTFFLIFSLFVMYISPYVIEPLFNKFTSLEGHELESRIKDMMKGAGIKVSRVFTIDASKRSRHTNAYFTGIGRVKRIVLFDTLISTMDQDEILAVLAHEAGHWKKRHVLKMIVVFELLSFIAAYISFRFLNSEFLAYIFEISGETFFAKLAVLFFLFGIVSFPFTPLFSYFSRRHEVEADRFAIALTAKPGSLATSLMKLSRDNLSNLYPHPLYADFYYSHPPVVERVRKIREKYAQGERRLQPDRN